MPSRAPYVTVCIPHFRCKKYIRRAVESVLAQTYRHLTLVVVNDGDPDSPWDQLAHISDSRLIRFNLAANHGPYFATAVVANATSAPYLLIQDADDWSAPDRLQRLLTRLEREQCDFVTSALAVYRETHHGALQFFRMSKLNKSRATDHNRLVWRFSHHGLWKVNSVRAVGGYYGGFRISYDLFLTNIMSLLGRVALLDLPLYCRVLRPTSLTTAPQTALRSPRRLAVERVLLQMYQEICLWCNASRRKEISRGVLFDRVREITHRNISPQAAGALYKESGSLRLLLARR